MSAPASARIAAGVDLLDVAPGERVLEAGCGHGVAVSLVAERIGDGHVTGLDRSATMIAAARARNAAHVAAGRASLICAPLDAADLGAERYDLAFAFHLPVLLRGDPSRELARVAAHLAPGGRLVVLFQPFAPDGVDPAVERLGRVLPACGFAVTDVRRRELAPAPVVAVVARPTGG